MHNVKGNSSETGLLAFFGEGRLPLSSGPRASSPALAGRGAAAGVYHTPEGSPPGGLSGPGAWVLHSALPVLNDIFYKDNGPAVEQL